MESTSLPSEIQVTEKMALLLEEKFVLEPRGEPVDIKGKGQMTSYLLIGLALSGLLVAASVTRRGVLMAGAALLVAVGPWGPEFALQIIFFVYAVFLMVMVARQTRDTSRGDNRISSWLSGLRVRLAPSPAPAAGTARPRPASSARYTAPQRRRR